MGKDQQSLSFLKISKQERRKFQAYNYAKDKYNFSRGALVAAMINLLLIPIEYFRVAEFDPAFWFRISTTVLYLLVYQLIKSHRGNVDSFQWLSLSLILTAAVLGLINDYFAQAYVLFLPNLLTAMIFFVHIISGLSFNKSLITNGIIMLMYIVYTFALGQGNRFLLQELPDMVSMSLLAAFLGYLIQKNKYERYQQAQIIEQQYDEISNEHEEYQKLNVVKDRLLSILSHDVRSPLDSLQGFLHLLEHKLLNMEEVEELLPQLKAKLTRTSDFVEHTLLWSKNQMGGFSPKLVNMNVKDLLQKTLDLYEYHIREKQLRIDLQCPEGLSIKADEEMTYIVARNLLNNAIKFSPKGTTITISAAEDTTKVLVKVKDEGVGISEEQIKQIFDIVKEPALGTKGEKGTGLGLSLSKEFMEKIGGSLHIASNQPDAGTTFSMIFHKA
ncbi:HAMP domain-containing sensor histidine kinase [Porifericola rhodea]|uniref:sensor histidine kinase n=1 Tax=Porifericola rhodea TaxID=930972 RepID=UPI002666F9ED|nr:HAMP domain-containing sensor histidine kinase [Porifericola rhodea]WKN29676.1 HAMP domain-containing sensor histidine kinase [Porifericola rhodea]